MAKWINRTVVAAPRNGTTSHTVTFTPAAAGSLLVAVIEGAVTSTTPTGWTLPAGGSAVNNTGLYVWSKVATAGEASFTTTHNGSNYPVAVMVYEFPPGSTFVGSTATTSSTSPNLTGLTGTNLLMGAGAVGVTNASAPVWSWTAPAGIVKDSDQTVPFSATDGYSMSVAYVEDSTATSWAPTASVTAATPTQERLSFAVKAAAASTGSAFNGSASLSGSGVLSTARTVAVAAAVALTGAGGLSATGTPGTSRTVALTGVGTVAAAGSPSTSRGVSLTGSGLLAATGAPSYAAAAPLAGSGLLSASGSASSAGAVTATLTGAGSLTATGRPAYAGTVNLAGAGTLAGSGAASQAGAITVPFTGSGSLTATGKAAASVTVPLAGVSALGVSGTPSAVVAVSLTGGGSLDATAVPGAATSAAFTGSGTLTVRGFNPSAARNITVAIGQPAGHPLTVGSPTSHPLRVDTPSGRAFTIGPPEAL